MAPVWQNEYESKCGLIVEIRFFEIPNEEKLSNPVSESSPCANDNPSRHHSDGEDNLSR
jgi:hypothetical protein